MMLLIAGNAEPAEQEKLQIEALKYGLGCFAAAGAAAALLLAVRRQLLAETVHDLSERNHRIALQAQAHTETDAAVRLGGLYRPGDLYPRGRGTVRRTRRRGPAAQAARRRGRVADAPDRLRRSRR
ncbi:hypothetical protein [Actinoplanes utahensis]|uniref:hypothetical protein n=1 Tax=Actinoplanes utahensis TaxID=1869 RepID=UPI00126A4797|nr:hypothetical protein [Actinoplanes utahensis]